MKLAATPSDEDEVYVMRKVHDASRAVAYPDSYPDTLRRELEEEGWECVPRHELTQARVRQPANIDVNVEIPDSDETYYLEHAPENHYTGFDFGVAEDLASRRGVSPDEITGAWYFPLRRRVEVAHETMMADKTTESLAVFTADDEEHERILDNAADDTTAEGTDKLTHDELAERIHANSGLYPRESEILASMARGSYMYRRIAKEIDDDISGNSVSKSLYQYTDRCEKIAWEVRHVWPQLPQSQITDEMQELIDSVDTSNPEAPLYLL